MVNGPWIEMVPGVRRRTIALVEKMMQEQVEFQPNVVTPVHQHVHEQLLYVAAGEIVLTVDGKEYTLKAGDAWSLKSNVPHGARSTGNGATLLDTFTPHREDFLAKDRAAGATY